MSSKTEHSKPDLTPRPHLVAFVDILGFGREIEVANSKPDLERIYEKMRTVQSHFQLASASGEPGEQATNNGSYGRKVLALSDAVVIGISPQCEMTPLMGGYDLLGFALYEIILAQAQCVSQGIFLRGGISHGSFFFENDVLLSPGLARAYEMESKHADVPVIVIPESTRQVLLTVPKQGYYAPEIDHLPKFFIKHGARTWKGEQLYYLDYAGAMLDEDDAPLFFKLHKRRIIDAYNSTSCEKVRAKYRWLMDYHNRSIPHGCLPEHLIDLTQFQPPKP